MVGGCGAGAGLFVYLGKDMHGKARKQFWKITLKTIYFHKSFFSVLPSEVDYVSSMNEVDNVGGDPKVATNSGILATRGKQYGASFAVIHMLETSRKSWRVFLNLA